MMRSCLALLLVALSAAPLAAQDPPATAPLESFVEEFARLWAAGDVEAILDMMGDEEPLLLDTGSGTATANTRHVAAELRSMFAQRETAELVAVRITVAGSEPLNGFGELSWSYRERGSPGEQQRLVYVAAIREGPSWRIFELRLLP